MKKTIFIIVIAIYSLMGSAFAQGFTEIAGSLLPVSGNSVICAGDFNNDELTDIVIAGKNTTQSFAKLFQNNGDSTFLDMGIGLPSLTFYAVNMNDLNNDGWVDILISGVNASNIPEFYIYINQQNGTFNSISHNIPGLRYGNIDTQDLNLDGFIDIFITGLTSEGTCAALYQNNGDLSFTESGIEFQGVYDGGIVLSDLNNDGFSDIFYTGLNASFNAVSYIFINNGDWDFTERTSDIPGIRGGKAKTADVNNDGYTDITVFGKNSEDQYITQIYKNNSGGAFTLFADLQGIMNGDISFADYNSDGYSDLLLSGKDQTDTYRTILYNNNSGVSFSDCGISFTGLSYSACQWIDQNNDGKIDFVLAGYEMAGPTVEMHSNNELIANAAPVFPSAMYSETDSSKVNLSWLNASDNEQAGKSLTYDIWLVNQETGEFILRPVSDTSNGVRKIIQQGSFLDTMVIIDNLDEGKYYWSVQSVDHGFMASDFAPKDSFLIAYPIFIGNDTAVCYNNELTLSVADYEGTAKWFSAKNPLVAFSTQKTVDINVVETDTIWVELTKSYGALVSDTIIIKMNALPIVDLGADRTICPGSTLELNIGSDKDEVNWNTESGDFIATNSTSFMNNFFENDKVFVELIDSNTCRNFDTLNVNMNVIPDLDLKQDTAVCKNETIHLTITNDVDSINWYSTSLGLLQANSNFFDLFAETKDTIWLDAYTDQGCVNYDTIIVLVRDLPVIDAGEDQLICGGYSTLIGPETSLNGAEYLWSPNNAIDNINSVNPTVNPLTETRYYVQVTDQYGCQSADSVLISINPTGDLDIGVNQSICPGENVELGGNPTATGSILPYSYEWSPINNMNGASTANPVVFPTQTTTYRLIVFTGSCPVDTLFTTVTVNPLPDIEIMNDTIGGFKEDIQIWATGGSSYEWSPTENIDNAYSREPTVNLEQTTRFVVKVTNEYGCIDTAGVTINIKNEVFIPELFTPNNDGNNDLFKVYGFGIKELSLSIYNDLGIVVYESSNVNEIQTQGWDGNYNGNPVKEGKYFWKLNGEFYNGFKVLFKGKETGIITLLR